MKSSYNESDVTILLNDVTGKVTPVSQEERKRLVEKGSPVRSVIIEEYPMTEKYTSIVKRNMFKYIPQMAKVTGILAEMLYKDVGDKLVLVDIARAGIPIGILLKRYIKKYYKIDIPHYSISLVDGLDPKAMETIINLHGKEGIRFIDGWTGKGTVANEIKKCVNEKYPGVFSGLSVLSDPINVAAFAGTRNDIYIPHSPLNAIATGLVSITVKNESFANETGYHSAVYLEELANEDISATFIEMVCIAFEKEKPEQLGNDTIANVTTIDKIATKINEDKKNLNPGINEAARAVLRRKLKKLLVWDFEDPQVEVLILLAKAKGIPVEKMNMTGYSAVSVANDNYIR